MNKMSWQFTSSVRGNLIAIIAIILVAGFATSSIISYQVSKESLHEALIGNELPLTSDNIYSEIQRDLLQPIFVASMMANNTFVRDWLLEGEVDTDRITRFLNEIRKQHGMFTSFLVSENTRRYYHFSGVSQIVSEDDPRDAWYFRVRDMTADYEINVDLNAEQENALTIFINHKVFDYDGNYLASIGVGMDFNTLATIAARYKENFSRHVYFVDGTGEILARSDGGSIGVDNIYDAEGVSSVAQHLLLRRQSFFEYERDNETMLVSARHIAGLDWWVIIEQKEANALAGIRQNLITNFFVGLIAISLTLVIVLYAVNFFYARLEQKAAEMAELADQEAKLNKQLKHESEVKDRFFSIISHDLISPFNALLLGTQMMSSRTRDYTREELVDIAGRVNDTAENVYNLLRNLLDWSHLQIDGFRVEPKNISVRNLVDTNIGVLGPLAIEKKIEIVNGVEDGSAYADQNMIETVLRNLMTNAVKLTEPGGRIEVSAKRKGGLVQITVRDTGVGISDEQIAKIFSADQNTSTVGTNGERGSGLGLTLCKEMIELNGGEFWIDTVVDEGSAFHFTLPKTPPAS